jgi:CheY-like chemotaxis protein
MLDEKKQAEILKAYLANRKVLIVDPGASSRASVHSLMITLGAKPFNVATAKGFLEGQEEMNANSPSIVLTEFNLGKNCGLELLQSHRSKNPESTKSLFIMMTSNTSQSAVARAAEEDVDAYILKPFSPSSLKKIIIKTAIAKIQPPPYVVQIEEGKAKLAKMDLDGAEANFKAAEGLDPQPALALYYQGQVRQLRKILEEAKGSYRKGLDFNKIHYKCMVGLYELQMASNNNAEAYEVVKKISQYFPANPKRLADVLRLAIINKSYEDVEKYYALFCNIDERNDNLVNYICAALVVCGKFYLQNANRSRALELFQKAAVTSAGRTKVIREIVQALYEKKIPAEAEKFLARYPAEGRQSEEFLLLDFLTASLQANATVVVAKGRNFLAKGYHDERVYETMIERFMEEKAVSSAENLLEVAGPKFPKIREKYASRLESLKRAAAS